MVNLLFDQILSSKGRIKILRLLLEHYELSISQIATITKLNHKSVKIHLKQLVKVGVLEEKIFGRIKVYRLRLEDFRIGGIRTLFALWDGSDSNIIPKS